MVYVPTIIQELSCEFRITAIILTFISMSRKTCIVESANEFIQAEKRPQNRTRSPVPWPDRTILDQLFARDR